MREADGGEASCGWDPLTSLVHVRHCAAVTQPTRPNVATDYYLVTDRHCGGRQGPGHHSSSRCFRRPSSPGRPPDSPAGRGPRADVLVGRRRRRGAMANVTLSLILEKVSAGCHAASTPLRWLLSAKRCSPCAQIASKDKDFRLGRGRRRRLWPTAGQPPWAAAGAALAAAAGTAGALSAHPSGWQPGPLLPLLLAHCVPAPPILCMALNRRTQPPAPLRLVPPAGLPPSLPAACRPGPPALPRRLPPPS